MSLITVKIADMQVTNNSEAVLVTYALGSCIAVVLHDPVCRAGGMLHFMLPQSRTDPVKAQHNPEMFADTGVPLLFEKMYSLGCRKPNIVVKVVGGAKIFNDHGVFEIGKKNYTILRKMLWKNKVMVTAEDVGGNKSRTVRLAVDNGQVFITSKGKKVEL